MAWEWGGGRRLGRREEAGETQGRGSQESSGTAGPGAREQPARSRCAWSWLVKRCEQGSSGYTRPPGPRTHLSLPRHSMGEGASAQARGVGSLRLLVGRLGACAQGSGGAVLGPGFPSPQLPWQRGCVGGTLHQERRTCPPALERGRPPPSRWPSLLLHLGLSSLGLVPRPSGSPCFSCYLLPVLLSPALLALLSAPPSAGMAVHGGRGLRHLSDASACLWGKSDRVSFLGV